MSRLVVPLLAGAVLAAAQFLPVAAQPAAAPALPAGPTTQPDPQAPPFKPGMPLLDSTGARVGTVQSVTDTPGGPNVVLSIDGKLVGVAPTTLVLKGETAVSRQTKAEILASAGAKP